MSVKWIDPSLPPPGGEVPGTDASRPAASEVSDLMDGVEGLRGIGDDDDLEEEVAEPRPLAEERKPSGYDLRSMVGHEVVVRASGIEYRGVLVEVSPTDVSIRSPLRSLCLPMSTVQRIRRADEPEGGLDPTKVIPPDFYNGW
jgi:hypothetical protein